MIAEPELKKMFACKILIMQKFERITETENEVEWAQRLSFSFSIRTQSLINLARVLWPALSKKINFVC